MPLVGVQAVHIEGNAISAPVVDAQVGTPLLRRLDAVAELAESADREPAVTAQR